MILTVIVLVYIYFKDKHSLYYHYRMEIIDNRVQFRFLKVYANIFSLYTFLIFILTQHLEIELWIAFGLMVFAIIVQTFLIKESEKLDDINEEEKMDELEFKDSYRKRYLNFVENMVSDPIDIEIE